MSDNLEEVTQGKHSPAVYEEFADLPSLLQIRSFYINPLRFHGSCNRNAEFFLYLIIIPRVKFRRLTLEEKQLLPAAVLHQTPLNHTEVIGFQFLGFCLFR